jgi:hypothetical protein
MATKIQLTCAFAVMAVGTPAFADDVRDPAWGWGTVDDSLKCVMEQVDGSETRVRDWVTIVDKTVSAPKNATPDCVAEVEKRAVVCTNDANMQRFLKEDPKNGQKQNLILKLAGADGPKLVCADYAWERVQLQMKTVPFEKRAQAAEKGQKELRKARAGKAELPKADKRDATIENMVNQAFKKAYPGAKILKTLIVGPWVNEKDAFSRTIGRNIQVVIVNHPKDEEDKDICEIFSEAWYQEAKGSGFAGPLSERGAGSLSQTPILCSKVK